MKKFIIITLLLLMVPSIIYSPKVEAKTIADLRRELQEIETRQRENNNKINMTQSEINSTQNQISQNYSDIDRITAEIIQTDEEIVELNKQIEEKDKTTKNLLSSLQTTNGNSFYIEYLFGADSITDFIYRYSITEQIGNYNDKLVKEMNEMIKENEEKKITLANKKEELSNKQIELQSSLTVLASNKKNLYQLGSDIEDEIRNAKQVIQMYLDAGCLENEDIKTCANKLLPPDTKFWRPFGPGYITSGYGWRYAIYSGGRVVSSTGIHEGLDLSNGLGKNNPIYSIANGKVVATWYDQWGGNQITIHHKINGTTYSSSYAHLSKILVKKGDVVTKDTVIGMMGDTGGATGPHLHLAISTGLRFTEYTGYNAYVARTVDPRRLINFPSSGSWQDRVTYYR